MFETKMMKATEKRVNALRKLENPTNEQKLMIWAYDNILGGVGCMGATLKEIESWGIEVYADVQMNGHTAYVPEMNGLTIRFPDYIHYTDTHGLNCLTIKDFNKLVKAIA